MSIKKINWFENFYLVWKIPTHLDRLIAWLDEVAKVAHNNTIRRLGKKNHKIITSELNFEWEH